MGWAVVGAGVSEHLVQAALFDWAQRAAVTYPELELLFAIPNGGHRHLSVAKKLKKEGVRAGVPDIFLPVARSPYHGLFIEMKFKKNGPTKGQRLWLTNLSIQGYCCTLQRDWEEASQFIVSYLKGEL